MIYNSSSKNPSICRSHIQNLAVDKLWRLDKACTNKKKNPNICQFRIRCLAVDRKVLNMALLNMTYKSSFGSPNTYLIHILNLAVDRLYLFPKVAALHIDNLFRSTRSLVFDCTQFLDPDILLYTDSRFQPKRTLQFLYKRIRNQMAYTAISYIHSIL